MLIEQFSDEEIFEAKMTLTEAHYNYFFDFGDPPNMEKCYGYVTVNQSNLVINGQAYGVIATSQIMGSNIYIFTGYTYSEIPKSLLERIKAGEYMHISDHITVNV